MGHFITMDETERGTPDWPELLAVDSVLPTPIDDSALRLRLRLTVLAAAGRAARDPRPGAGDPDAALASRWHHSASGSPWPTESSRPPARSTTCTVGSPAGCWRDRIEMSYDDTTGRGFIGRPVVWFRDPARWRDFAYLAFSATGGLVMSGLVVGTLANPTWRRSSWSSTRRLELGHLLLRPVPHRAHRLVGDHPRPDTRPSNSPTAASCPSTATPSSSSGSPR